MMLMILILVQAQSTARASSDYEKDGIKGVLVDDMMLSEEQLAMFHKHRTRRGSLDLRKYPRGGWWLKNNKGEVVVSYSFSKEFTPDHRKIVRYSLDDLEEGVSCMKFVEDTKASDRIRFVYGDRCWSQVGRVGGVQRLELRRGECVNRFVVTHEVIHALGFFHEQNRGDRNEYVEILYQNIKPGQQVNFDMISKDYWDSYGSAYNTQSIMHYKSNSFSKNGEPTIRSKVGSPVGGTHLTMSDKYQLYDMYKCYNKHGPPELLMAKQSAGIQLRLKSNLLSMFILVQLLCIL